MHTTVAEVEGHHGAVVHAQRDGHVGEGEAEAQRADGTEEKVGVVVAVIDTHAHAVAAPELPGGETRCPVGP